MTRNKEHAREYGNKYRAEHTKEIKEYWHKYSEDNREKLRENWKKYREENKDKGFCNTYWDSIEMGYR